MSSLAMFHDVAGTSPIRGAKNPRSSERGFFICAAGTTSFDRRSTSFRATREHHFSFLRHKWTRLSFAQMKLRQAANDVMLRLNDVGFCPMMLRSAQRRVAILSYEHKKPKSKDLGFFHIYSNMGSNAKWHQLKIKVIIKCQLSFDFW